VNKKNNRKMRSLIPRYPLQEFQIDLIHLDDSHLNNARYGKDISLSQRFRCLSTKDCSPDRSFASK
jgi:hypothetical protein